ncbi:avidin/streptavidin family protein [Tropicibacter sp. S64]|uniref:avidin/streptavidin family protein n=1 Tax=Tropicibacter sp. S64 TaxID=3415122 RepID=UPI003C7DF962
MAGESAIDGTWYNVYGSKMELWANPDNGFIIGSYSSTTGSSGTYLVLGASQASVAQPVAGGNGFAVSLTIGWSSTSGGTRDPSWSCVSGLAGQMVVDETGAVVLSLIHQFVAPNDVPLGTGEAFEIGISSDKLIYTRTPPEGGVGTEDAVSPDLPAASGEMTTWTCVEDPSMSFEASAVSTTGFKGAFGGAYTAAGGSNDLLGQADWDYPQDKAYYQAYCLSSLVEDPTSGKPMAVALAGWIDPATGLLTVLEMRSVGTTWDTRYAGVRTRGLTFRAG